MDSSDYRERLRGQIKESYGKLLYTYQTQQEAATLKRTTTNRISISQIILTAVSTCGVISVIIGQTGTGVGAVVASITSALSLGLNLYTVALSCLRKLKNTCVVLIDSGLFFRTMSRCLRILMTLKLEKYVDAATRSLRSKPKYTLKRQGRATRRTRRRATGLRTGTSHLSRGRLTNCCRRACVAVPERNSVLFILSSGLGLSAWVIFQVGFYGWGNHFPLRFSSDELGLFNKIFPS